MLQAVFHNSTYASATASCTHACMVAIDQIMYLKRYHKDIGIPQKQKTAPCASYYHSAAKPLALEAAGHRFLLKRSLWEVENWVHDEALRVVQVRQLQHNKTNETRPHAESWQAFK